ncbi:hypothetical protein HDU93_004091, partial [Gonapodya sp. JEL0774]
MSPETTSVMNPSNIMPFPASTSSTTFLSYNQLPSISQFSSVQSNVTSPVHYSLATVSNSGGATPTVVYSQNPSWDPQTPRIHSEQEQQAVYTAPYSYRIAHNTSAQPPNQFMLAERAYATNGQPFQIYRLSPQSSGSGYYAETPRSQHAPDQQLGTVILQTAPSNSAFFSSEQPHAMTQTTYSTSSAPAEGYYDYGAPDSAGAAPAAETSSGNGRMVRRRKAGSVPGALSSGPTDLIGSRTAAPCDLCNQV